MSRGQPFYLQENIVQAARRHESVVRREINRILEREPEGERLQYEITRYILALIAAGGILASIAVAPGLAYGVKWLADTIYKQRGFAANNPNEKYWRLKRTIEYLHRKRLIHFIRDQKKIRVETTEQGRARLLAYALQDLAIPPLQRWDGTWRLIIFDIPETRKTARDVFRKKLRDLGFFQLQKSAFVHPHPCQAEIDFIAELFHLWPYITLVETKNLGRQEAEARQHFNLL